jgi:hypothetical protein
VTANQDISRPPHTSDRTGRRRHLVRLGAVSALVVLAGGLVAAGSSAVDEPSLAAVPKAKCGPGSRPETDIQGRVPTRDYDSGRAAKGYTCNARQVAHHGHSGGFKVFSYVDPAGHTCAFYDSTLLFPTDVPYNVGAEGLGVITLDMTDPARPVRTAALSTPAMDSPHESLMLSNGRGLLVAVVGNLLTAPGVVEIYDVKDDCRHPQLLSSTPTGLLGHESGLSPDGRTFYVSSTSGNTLAAIDISDPTLPRTLWTRTGVNYHGLRVSPDGNSLYVANIGYPSDKVLSNGGLTILDVSDIQARKANPEVPEVSTLQWRSGSIPQAAMPVRIKGHDYLLEIDEFANYRTDTPDVSDPDAKVGAARLINVDDEKRPFLVSNIRLAVNNQKARHGSQQDDPGASVPVQGYAGHYCSVPRRVDPGLAACSFIASGLRVFDIRDPYHPREVAYFNKPTMPGTSPGREGAYAMSAPAWDVKHQQVWYTDGNRGFFAVRLTNRVGRLL